MKFIPQLRKVFSNLDQLLVFAQKTFQLQNIKVDKNWQHALEEGSGDVPD